MAMNLTTQASLLDTIKDVMSYKGTKTTYQEIEALADMTTGDVWECSEVGREGFYIYDGAAWKLLGSGGGGSIDTTNLAKLDAENTFTALNTFDTLPQSEATPTDNKDLITKQYNDNRLTGVENNINTKIGNLTQLTTTAKDNLVNAINEVNNNSVKVLTQNLTWDIGPGGDFEDLYSAYRAAAKLSIKFNIIMNLLPAYEITNQLRVIGNYPMIIIKTETPKIIKSSVLKGKGSEFNSRYCPFIRVSKDSSAPTLVGEFSLEKDSTQGAEKYGLIGLGSGSRLTRMSASEDLLIVKNFDYYMASVGAEINDYSVTIDGSLTCAYILEACKYFLINITFNNNAKEIQSEASIGSFQNSTITGSKEYGISFYRTGSILSVFEVTRQGTGAQYNVAVNTLTPQGIIFENQIGV